MVGGQLSNEKKKEKKKESRCSVEYTFTVFCELDLHTSFLFSRRRAGFVYGDRVSKKCGEAVGGWIAQRKLALASQPDFRSFN